MENNILSIDQSLNNSGITIKNNSYIFLSIKPNKKLSTLDKLIYIRKKLLELIKKYNITIILREGFSFSSKFGMVFDLGALGFLIDIIAYDCNIKSISIPPLSHKKFTTGKGNSNKSLILLSVYKKYGIEVQDDNIADSLSIIKTYESYLEYLKGNISSFKRYEIEVIEKMLKDNLTE